MLENHEAELLKTRDCRIEMPAHPMWSLMIESDPNFTKDSGGKGVFFVRMPVR